MVVNVPLAPVVERSTSKPVSLGELSCQPRLIAPGRGLATRPEGPCWAAASSDGRSVGGSSGCFASQTPNSTKAVPRANRRAIGACIGRLLRLLVDMPSEFFLPDSHEALPCCVDASVRRTATGELLGRRSSSAGKQNEPVNPSRLVASGVCTTRTRRLHLTVALAITGLSQSGHVMAG